MLTVYADVACIDVNGCISEQTDIWNFKRKVVFKNRAHTAGQKAIYTVSLLDQEEGPLGQWLRVTVLKDVLALPAQLRQLNI